MAYNKQYDTMPLEECIRVHNEITEDSEYKLSKTKSPKSKRHELAFLKFHNSVLGRLQELKNIKDAAGK